MSSRPSLTPEEYSAILAECIEPELRPLAPFFANPRRLRLLGSMLQRHLPEPPGLVLDVGCGPFASECFCDSLSSSRFVACDYTPGFRAVYDALRSRGLLANTEFILGSASDLDFEPQTFDLILMHDLLYEPALNAPVLIERYRAYLKPGGLLFFDVMDRRAGPLWWALGREKPHRRYDLKALKRHLDHGWTVLESKPYLGVRGPLDAIFRHGLWYTCRLANNYAFLIRSR